MRGMRLMVKKPSLGRGDWSRPGVSPSTISGPKPASPAAPRVRDPGQPGSGVNDSPDSAARGTGFALPSRGREGGTGDERGVVAQRPSRGNSGMRLLIKKTSLGRGERAQPGVSFSPTASPMTASSSAVARGGPGTGNLTDSAARGTGFALPSRGREGGAGDDPGVVAQCPVRGNSGMRLLVKKLSLGRGEWTQPRSSRQAQPVQGAGVGTASAAVAGEVGGGDGSAREGGAVVMRPSHGISGVWLLSQPPRERGAGARSGMQRGTRGPLSPRDNGPAGSQPPRDVPRTGLLPTLSLSR